MTTVYDRGRKVNVTSEGITVTRVLYVEPYLSYSDVVATLMGGVRLVGRRLIRTLPKRDPIHKWLFVHEVDVEGEGAWVGTAANGTALLDVANYYNNGAVLTCTYKPVPTNTVEGPSASAQQEIEFAEKTLDFSAQNLTLPNDRYKWHTSGEVLANQNLAVVKKIPKVEFVLLRNYVLNVPFRSILSLSGRINTSTFTAGGFIWPAETLRFDGAHTSLKYTNTGLQYYKMTYKFAAQAIYDKIESGSDDFVGWNRAFDAKLNRWDVVDAVSSSSRKMHLGDAAVGQTMPDGTTVTGFNLLFDPRAT